MLDWLLPPWELSHCIPLAISSWSFLSILACPMTGLARSSWSSLATLACPMTGLDGAACEEGERLSCSRLTRGGEAVDGLLVSSGEELSSSNTKLPIVVWLPCDEPPPGLYAASCAQQLASTRLEAPETGDSGREAPELRREVGTVPVAFFVGLEARGGGSGASSSAHDLHRGRGCRGRSQSEQAAEEQQQSWAARRVKVVMTLSFPQQKWRGQQTGISANSRNRIQQRVVPVV
mmetsp:Transcript_25931/g.60111  ORF Transcript_25931/g.60111 Transcript_25931/m.60111 type:complete len:234 (+) Transcript_25931:1107-1808(+)